MTAKAAVSAIACMINSEGQLVICGTSVAVLAIENTCKSFSNRVEAVSSSAPDLSHIPSEPSFPTVPHRFTENLHFYRCDSSRITGGIYLASTIVPISVGRTSDV